MAGLLVGLQRSGATDGDESGMAHESRASSSRMVKPTLPALGIGPLSVLAPEASFTGRLVSRASSARRSLLLGDLEGLSKSPGGDCLKDALASILEGSFLSFLALVACFCRPASSSKHLREHPTRAAITRRGI